MCDCVTPRKDLGLHFATCETWLHPYLLRLLLVMLECFMTGSECTTLLFSQIQLWRSTVMSDSWTKDEQSSISLSSLHMFNHKMEHEEFDRTAQLMVGSPRPLFSHTEHGFGSKYRGCMNVMNVRAGNKAGVWEQGWMFRNKIGWWWIKNMCLCRFT